MGRRLILVGSVCLNVILAAVLLAAWHRAKPSPAPDAEVQSTGTNAIRTRFVVRKQFFTWQELESADYPTYVGNLRDLGCPEQTIHDIIVTDVDQLYTWKRLTEVIAPEQAWWLTTPDTNLAAAATAKRVSLEQERRELLTALLGTNADLADTLPHLQVALTGPVLGDLSPEVKRAVMNILVRAEQRTQAFRQAQVDAGKPLNDTEFAMFEPQKRGELAQVLNPAQMDEYLLRYSTQAAALRQNLRGMDLSPDEFRKLCHLYEPIEQQMRSIALNDSQSRYTNEMSLVNQYYDAVKDVLGQDRYQAYRMATDPAYREAVTEAQNTGASPQLVQTLYELNRATLDEQNRILNDPNLTADQKAAQLQALEQKQQLASDQILGVPPPAPTPEPSPPLPPLPPPAPAEIHPYSPGETIEQIAAQYGVTTTAILNANPNLDFNHLSRGAGINIPPPPSQ